MNDQLDYPYKFGITTSDRLKVVKSGWQQDIILAEKLQLSPNAGDGDLALNFESIDAVYRLDTSIQQGFQVYPIVLSERDIANTIIIPSPFPKYKFLLVNRRQPMDGLGLSIGYYACLVNLLHTSACDIDWKYYILGNPQKNLDFWLLVKQVQSNPEREHLNNIFNKNRNNLGFPSIKNTIFYMVDAVAAIGSVFEPITREGLKQFATIEGEQDLIHYPNLALKWVAKHPGCSVKKYISKSLPIWQKHYQKRVLAEPPLSEAMQKLVDKRIIKSA